MRTDRRTTDMTKLTVAFRNFANAPKIYVPQEMQTVSERESLVACTSPFHAFQYDMVPYSLVQPYLLTCFKSHETFDFQPTTYLFHPPLYVCRCVRVTTLPPLQCRKLRKSRSLNLLEPKGPTYACSAKTLPLFVCVERCLHILVLLSADQVQTSQFSRL